MKRKIVDLIALIVLTLAILFSIVLAADITANSAKADVELLPTETRLYVTANRLNGRSAPRKTASIEAIFDKGDKLRASGAWSLTHKWVEVYGGETGTVWCDIRYVNELLPDETFVVKNVHYNKVRIRRVPVGGKTIGYLKRGRELTITQVVLGWGKCRSGWIDMSYVEKTQQEQRYK